MGTNGVPEFQSGAAGNGNLPPSESGIFSACGLRCAIGRTTGGLSRLTGGNGFAYHDGERTRRVWLGRRRNRSRSSDVRTAELDAGTGGSGIQAAREITGRGY